ncbi:DUF2384 domain-containing protein [Salipiger thiooxidans]|nr:DUF2384 domain-containing protein [Salipiger thiooxidans]
MQRAFIKLAELWGLTDEQASVLMGDISVRTFRRWKAGELGRAGIDTAARLSNLMGIHKALRLLFKDPARGYGWIKRPNTVFGGSTALEVMLGGQITDLMRARRTGCSLARRKARPTPGSPRQLAIWILCPKSAASADRGRPT